MTMTRVEYTDPAVMVPGMTDGLDSWMPLSDDQRCGWACIACGRNAQRMRPVGRCDDGQVSLCVTCHDLWASDVPVTRIQDSGDRPTWWPPHGSRQACLYDECRRCEYEQAWSEARENEPPPLEAPDPRT